MLAVRLIKAWVCRNFCAIAGNAYLHWFFNSICISQQSLEKAIVFACLKPNLPFFFKVNSPICAYTVLYLSFPRLSPHHQWRKPTSWTMTFTLRSPEKIAQVVPRNVMNNFNEHEIIVEHKNIFAPTRAWLSNLFLAMYPFSIPTDEYVPINFLMTNDKLFYHA